MHIAPGLAELFGKLPHQPEDRVADILGLMLERVAIKRDGWREPRDHIRRLARNQAETSLRNRERGLRLDVALQQVIVGKHPAHFGGAEHVLEDVAVENRGRHQ